MAEWTPPTEETFDRLMEGQWQAGYTAAANDAIHGTTCGRRLAAVPVSHDSGSAHG